MAGAYEHLDVQLEQAQEAGPPKSGKDTKTPPAKKGPLGFTNVDKDGSTDS